MQFLLAIAVHQLESVELRLFSFLSNIISQEAGLWNRIFSRTYVLGLVTNAIKRMGSFLATFSCFKISLVPNDTNLSHVT